MTTVVIVGVLLVLWLLVIVRWQPGDGSPVVSVDHQHRALHALHDAAERSRVGVPDGVAPVGVNGAPHRPGRTRPRVPEGSRLLPVPAGAEPARRRARLSRPAAAAVLAVALAGAGLAADTVVGRRSPADHEAGAPPHSPVRTAPRPDVAAPPEVHTARPAPGGGTTVPTAREDGPRVVSSDPRGAVVAVTAGGHRLSIAASGGRCWVQVAAARGGTTGGGLVLESGRTRTLTVAGPATVRLGNAAAVALAVDGRAVALPSLPPGPYRVELRPGAAS